MTNMVKTPLKKEWEEEEAHFIIPLIYSNHFLVGQALAVCFLLLHSCYFIFICK